MNWAGVSWRIAPPPFVGVGVEESESLCGVEVGIGGYESIEYVIPYVSGSISIVE